VTTGTRYEALLKTIPSEGTEELFCEKITYINIMSGIIISIKCKGYCKLTEVTKNCSMSYRLSMVPNTNISHYNLE
jgi:hypothetical protein